MKTKCILRNMRWLFLLLVNFSVCGCEKEIPVEIIKRGEYTIKLADMRVRDPFILVDTETRAYYLHVNNKPSFKLYKSLDLVSWKDMGNTFTGQPNFWGKNDFWAPDTYHYKDKYYIFATFSSDTKKRGTSILVSDKPDGPYSPLVNQAVTPENWMSLDGALLVDKEQKPWIIFCREWLEVTDGQVVAQRLSDDLKTTIGDPQVLFKATDAPWVGSIKSGDITGYVTDAPFIYKVDSGELIMLWSSFRKDNGRYAIGQAISKSGSVTGPWEQVSTPLNDDDGGHAMLFRDLDGRLMISYHAPNSQTETPRIQEVFISNGQIVLSK